ncbi:hypothetical protein [Deinococcus pimensis]|uniref:hypothetical protein n=1 Tax=Deinococcus pimensis TaxID=309888 RepID=UPI0006948E09|nr:hypothetical protein [Deinococcus pimensis]
MAERRPSAIRQTDKRSNIVAARVRLARHLHVPPLTIAKTSQRATELSGYKITRDALVRIENQQRSVYDYEVAALARALGVDANYLLGLTDEPGVKQQGSS